MTQRELNVRLMMPGLLAGLLMATLGSPARAQGNESFKIIVHASNPVASLGKEQVSKLFLKKVTRWESGQKVAAVDLSESSALREHFSKTVLGKSVTAVKAYWQQEIYSGREVPPPEKASDSQVLAYVKANPNAIGYVSASTPVVDGVRVVQLSSLADGAVGAASASALNAGSSQLTIVAERPAVALPGSPQPRYPSMLRSAGIEGRVFAEFVIDTAGHADMTTFRALSSSNPLFTSAVRDAVARMRFAPMEVDGRVVRILARQEFAFSLRQ